MTLALYISLMLVPSLYNKAKDEKDKAKLNLKGLKSQKKKRHQDTTGTMTNTKCFVLPFFFLEFSVFGVVG